jgi:uncharacterized membrane protein
MSKRKGVVFGIIFGLLGLIWLIYGLSSLGGESGGHRLSLTLLTGSAGGGCLVVSTIFLTWGIRTKPNPRWAHIAIWWFVVCIFAVGGIYLTVLGIISFGSKSGSAVREGIGSLVTGLLLLGSMISGFWSSRKQ